MPQRKRVIRFDSPKIQGDDSWVEVSRLTVGEARRAEKIKDDPDTDSFAEVVGLYQTHIINWNWVDDDGSPLPLPKDDPDVVDGLTADEFSFLGDCLAGSEEDQKK